MILAPPRVECRHDPNTPQVFGYLVCPHATNTASVIVKHPMPNTPELGRIVCARCSELQKLPAKTRILCAHAVTKDLGIDVPPDTHSDDGV